VKALEKKRVDEYVSRLETDALKVSTELMAKQQAGDVQALLTQQQMVLSRLRDSETQGRIVIDLTNREVYNNFILENGDSLYVPKQLGTVSVIGEVFNPATFRYETGFSKAKYYVEMAGGLRENADVKKIYIFKANGSVLTQKNIKILDYELSPGDVIVVPQRVIFKDNFKIFMDAVDSIVKVTSLLLSLAALIVILKRPNS
jgi:polysaccharide export outer membrane protein